MMRYTTWTTVALTGTLLAATACGRNDRAESASSDTTAMATGASTAAGATAGTSGGTLANDDVDIEGLTLGRTLGADGKISDKTDEFRPTDDVIAVVETDDNEAGKELMARWTFGDGAQEEVVNEQRQTVAAGSDARTAFRLAKQTALAVGKYHVRIFYNNKEVKSEDFQVKQILK